MSDANALKSAGHAAPGDILRRRYTPIPDKQEGVFAGRDSSSPRNMIRWEKPKKGSLP